MSVNELERVLTEYPILSKIYDLVYLFKSVLFIHTPNELDLWIEDARQLNISEVNSSINGVSNDIDGVRHAILYPHSNWLAEGSVNKLKVIKRIMYGRCNFDTFRREVLLLEKFRDFN